MMKTLKDYGVYETPKLSTDKIVELKKVPKDILRAMWDERMRTVEIVAELARKQATA